MKFKKGTFFENSVCCHEWHIAQLWMSTEASQALPAVGSFLTFADLVLAAGSAHWWSCETSPVKGTCTQWGQSLHFSNWPWAKKSPQSWLCWNSPSALPCACQLNKSSRQNEDRTQCCPFQNLFSKQNYYLQVDAEKFWNCSGLF